MHFSSLLQKIDWFSADIDSDSNLLNDILHSVMNQCLPARSVSMSNRDPGGSHHF